MAGLQRRFASLALSSPTYTCCRASTSVCHLASTSGSSFPSNAVASAHLQSSSFHTSAPALEKRAKRLARLRKKANLSRRVDAAATLAKTTPDPVRGYGPNNERLWLDCELRKILLDREAVWRGELGEVGMLSDLENKRDNVLGPKGATSLLQASVRNQASSPADSATSRTFATSSSSAAPSLPYLNFGLSPSDGNALLHRAPLANAWMALQPAPRSDFLPATSEAEVEHAQAAEKQSTDSLSRIVDLRNTNARGIRFENTRRILRRFGQGEGSGRVEVQVAIMTMRIHTIADRLLAMPRDVHSKRYLRKLVMDRAAQLKYLKRYNLERYVQCLKDIGVEQRAVEGEIIVR